MARGNLSNVKNVGAGVFERVIDFGPGFRVYLDKDGDRLVIRLGGRTKKKQSTDIANAQARNLFEVIGYLQKQEGLRFELRSSRLE